MSDLEITQFCLVCGVPSDGAALCPAHIWGNGPDEGPIADAPDGALRPTSDDLIGYWGKYALNCAATGNGESKIAEMARSTVARLLRDAARIRELEAQREWRPGITAPKDGTRFLGAYQDGDGWTHHESFYINDPQNGVIGWFMQAPWQGEQTDRQPDYWQPLTSPAAPVDRGVAPYS
jgi:hypothetical protein